MNTKRTAHRPSQANQQYVKNPKGEMVLNTAYKGYSKNTGNGSHNSPSSDFSLSDDAPADVADILDDCLSDEVKDVPIHRVDAREVEEYVRDAILDYLEKHPESSEEDALDSGVEYEVASDITLQTAGCCFLRIN